MEAYAGEWLQLLIRWIHLITGIAWIGASFYFVWLDNFAAAARKEDADAGVGGELWAVHGGGFYHVQKFRVGARRHCPQPLHWFKWEAYWTWMSAASRFSSSLYYAHADIYWSTASVADLAPWQAIALSRRAACRPAGCSTTSCASGPGSTAKDSLAAAMIAFFALVAWGLSHVFSGRAMYMQVGAMLGTIMAWNVFFVIMPSQRKLVEATRAGRRARSGLRAARQAALRAQQLFHAAGAVRHDQQPLPDDVRAIRARGWS